MPDLSSCGAPTQTACQQKARARAGAQGLVVIGIELPDVVPLVDARRPVLGKDAQRTLHCHAMPHQIAHHHEACARMHAARLQI
jgi:hypothetical protein